jgi:hypothetical protein
MIDTAVDIIARSYHYDADHRAYVNALPAAVATEIARGYREIAKDPHFGTARDLAIAAYYQSVADRKRTAAPA